MAQLNDLLVMGQSTLLGPTKIQNTLSVSGQTTIQNTLSVSGQTTIQNTLSVSGETTLSGVLKLANGTWNHAGDDAYFGDNNTAGSFAIKGINGTTNLKMVKYDGTDYGTLSWDGSEFTLSHILNGNLDGNASSANRLVSRGNVTMETGTNVPAVAGLSMSQVYNNGYLTTYGNVMTMSGGGHSQLLIGWSGTSGATAPAYIRSKRDVAEAEWSDWQQLATTDMIATTSALGLVKSTTTGTEAGRYYDVEVEADGTMRVNVPWTNTWKPNSDTQEGYVAQAGKTLAGKVWKVDADGKPKWLAHSSGKTYTAGSNISISSSNAISVATNPNFGTGYVTAAYYVATSDRRLKENLVEFTPKQSILDLPIYKYDFIEGDKNQIGCMAQDLQKICPELIKENDETGYLSIQESKIVYLLIDEVKKLKSQIQQLEKEV